MFDKSNDQDDLDYKVSLLEQLEEIWTIRNNIQNIQKKIDECLIEIADLEEAKKFIDADITDWNEKIAEFHRMEDRELEEAKKLLVLHNNSAQKHQQERNE